MQDKFVMELSNGVVQLAQQGRDWKKLLEEAQEIYELTKQAVKKNT